MSQLNKFNGLLVYHLDAKDKEVNIDEVPD